MKDPLVRRPTPYETLKVGEGAGKGEVDAAFKARLAEGKNIGEIREAWNLLSKPATRGMVDIFLYNEAFLRKLVPRVDREAGALVERRGAVAQAWEGVQRRFFPDFGATHSLAVLWLNWALHEEERRHREKEGGPVEGMGTPEGGVLWRKAIAGWAFVVASEEFWREWRETREGAKGYLGEGDLEGLSRSVEGHLGALFQGQIERYRGAGEGESVRRHQEYDLLFATELRTARQLNKAGVQVPKGERKVGVSAGRLMLQELGLLESVRVQVGRLAEERPADEKLKNLAAGLSPYADIAVLVENRKYDEAIAALTGLGPEALGAKEAKRLLARSYLEKGRQEFSLKRYDAALENWKKGLAVGELGEEIRQTVVGETKSRAALLQTSEPETAIGMLRKAGKVVKDKELTETLAEILTTRGIGLINEAQKKLQEGKEGLTAEIETQIDKGVKCLKEAKDLGSKRGAENYERAKGLVEQAKSGLLGLDPEIAGLINQAHKAAEGSRWDEAIRLMKKARDKAPEAGREALEKMLAQFYNARGVQKLSGATSRMKTLKDMMLSGKGNFDLSAFMKDGLGKNLSSKSSGKAKTAKTNKKKALVWILIAAVVIVLLLMINKSSMKIPKFVTVLLYAAWILAMIAPVLVELFAKMRKFFKTTLNPNLYMPHIYGQPPRPKCSWCDKTADYTYDGQYLCSGCVETAKTMNEPHLAPGDDLVVKSARSDFEKAAKLDPGTSVFRSNLDQAREICRQFNLV